MIPRISSTIGRAMNGDARAEVFLGAALARLGDLGGARLRRAALALRACDVRGARPGHVGRARFPAGAEALIGDGLAILLDARLARACGDEDAVASVLGAAAAAA